MKANNCHFMAFAFFAALLLGSCAPHDAAPRLVSFEGKWKETIDNALTDTKQERNYDIITDGKRFRVENEAYVNVYDGSKIYQKYKPGSEQYQYSSSAAGSLSEAGLKAEAARQHMFWLRGFSGKAAPGGMIAGRETMLYGGDGERPDVKASFQYWVDKETGVLLKSSEIIYSKQIEQMVSKTNMECSEIRYGSVSEGCFAKP